MKKTFVCANPFNRNSASARDRLNSCPEGNRPPLRAYPKVYDSKPLCMEECHDGYQQVMETQARDRAAAAATDAIRSAARLAAQREQERRRAEEQAANAPPPQRQQPPPQRQQPPPQRQQPPPQRQQPPPQRQPPPPQRQQPSPSTEEQIRLRERALAAQREREERAKAEERIRQQEELRIPTQEELRLQEIQRQAARDALAALDRLAKAGLNQPQKRPHRNIYQPVPPQRRCLPENFEIYVLCVSFFIILIIPSIKILTGDYSFQQIEMVGDIESLDDLQNDLQIVLNFLEGKISDHTKLQRILQKIKQNDSGVSADIIKYESKLEERYPEYKKFKRLGNKKIIKMIEKATNATNATNAITYEKPLLIQHFKFKKSRSKNSLSRSKKSLSRSKKSRSKSRSKKSRSKSRSKKSRSKKSKNVRK